MIISNLTPAGFTYLARLFEQAVDEGLNVGEIHGYLTRKGISITRAEVAHQLENVFGFTGYAKAIPAQRPISYAEADAMMRKPARRLPAAGLSQGQDRKIASTDPAKIYQTAC